MLKQISLKNFAIIDKLDVDFKSGMTIITGEAGAGKSIIIDAIGLALGERASGNPAKNPGERTEICLSFDIVADKKSMHWLESHALDAQENCLIRRVIGADGKSKCFINDTPTTLQKTKELGELLVNIHGQHENQQLFQRDEQRETLDAFAGNQTLCKQVKNIYQQWHEATLQVEQLKKNSHDAKIRSDFLNYN